MLQLNLLAIIVAASSSFMLGGLWYSPALFGNTWNREAGPCDNCKQEQGHPAKVFGVSFIFALLAAFVYAWLMPAAASAPIAAGQGLAVGGGLVAASFGINYQFANRSTKLLLIDGGYHLVQFLIYGLVIGAWH
ncbi:hypothetical protein GCM10027277_23870 [Pseudoduganella ginsengisoli]|uniref:DUF1761 family protein n=1 Tax=Pseudoduganella ginsengisoli TaxID=1462440 RepID=A0A6L6PZV1_9BURK|nr:DUF1761 domain-containing protein [Pseudoduganella ginsengisoli]MTW02890.1 DUF1761 family protein [Pseudoduganella ginsengisoli]